MKVSGSGLTHVGRVRSNNEDAFLVDDELGLYVVSDGLGGHAAGERAARMATKVVRHCVRGELDSLRAVREDRGDHRVLRKVALDAALEACRHVYHAAHDDPELAGMGCTLTLLLVAGAKAAMAHVGDTRLYLYRDGSAWQLSTDHTLAEESVRRGVLTPDAALEHPYSAVLTRSLGLHESVQVETLILDVLPDDVFLLCSDGLTKHLESLGELAAALSETELSAIPPNLIALANERGGTDNISALAVRIEATQGEEDECLDTLEQDVRAGLKALRALSVFRRAPFGDLLRLFDFATFGSFRPGETVFERGCAVQCLALLIEGECELLEPSGSGRTLLSGESFSPISLLLATPCLATLRARTRSKLLFVDGEKFRQLALRRPSFGVPALVALARHLRDNAGSGAAF